MGAFLKNIVFYKSHNFGSPIAYRFWKRWAPENDEDPLNKILKILDMGSTCPENMEWKFGHF